MTHYMTDYYAVFIAICIGVVVLNILFDWWEK